MEKLKEEMSKDQEGTKEERNPHELWTSLPEELRTTASGYHSVPKEGIFFPSKEAAYAETNEIKEKYPTTAFWVTPEVIMEFEDDAKLGLSLNHGTPKGKTLDQWYDEQIEKMRSAAKGARNVKSISKLWNVYLLSGELEHENE